MGKKTLIIGASENTERYAAKAVQMLTSYNHEVIALGNKEGNIHGVPIESKASYVQDIDTVSLYINETIQRFYYSYVISLNPKRVIFNPGTENSEFARLLRENDISIEIACTLVLLRTGQY